MSMHNGRPDLLGRYWRRRFSRRQAIHVGAIAGGGLAALSLVGCGDDDDDDDGEANGTATTGGSGSTTEAGGSPTAAGGGGEPVRGGTLRTGTFLDVLGIDPHIEVSVGLTTDALMYAYLGAFSTVQNEFHPQFTESIEQPSDTEYVFSLHQGFNFQNLPPVNGREMTAEDVVYSFERFRDLPQAQNNSFFKLNVVSMEAVDPYTFKVTLNAPYAEALVELGGVQSAIVPREAVEQFGDLSSQGVGAGPYILDEYVKSERERLVRNPDYFFADEVYLDAFERIVVLDMSTLIQSYLNDQLDLNGALLTKVDYDSLPDNLVNWAQPALHYASLGLNASMKPYDDPRVRKALYLAMDRQQFIDKLGFGDGTPMGPLSTGLEYWVISEEELAPYIGPNYDEAKSLLSAAGVEEGFEMPIETSGGVQLYIDHANIVVPELKKVGINATLNLSELGDYLSNKLFAGNFTTTVFTHNPYETPKIPLGFYHKNGIGNGSWWHYTNEDISAQYEAMMQELDGETRLQMVKDLQIAILEDSAPLINLYSPMGYGSHHPRLKNYDPTLRGYEGREFNEWIDPEE